MLLTIMLNKLLEQILKQIQKQILTNTETTKAKLVLLLIVQNPFSDQESEKH